MDALASRFELSEKETCVMFAMTQYELFGMFGAADLDDLSRGIELRKQMTRKRVSRLEALGLVTKVPQRPLQFSLPDGVKEFLGMRDSARYRFVTRAARFSIDRFRTTACFPRS